MNTFFNNGNRIPIRTEMTGKVGDVFFILGVGRTNTLNSDTLGVDDSPLEAVGVGTLKIKVSIGISRFAVKRGDKSIVVLSNQYIQKGDSCIGELQGELYGWMGFVTSSKESTQGVLSMRPSKENVVNASTIIRRLQRAVGKNSFL